MELIKNLDIHQLFIILLLLFIIIIFVISKKNLWIRAKLRYLLYDNLVLKIIRHKFFQLLLPGLASIYYMTLDIWGDDWKIITNYKHVHENIFLILIGMSLLVLFVRGIADWYETRSNTAYIAFMERLSTLTSRLVKFKLNRFKEKAKYLKPNGNTFKAITNPKEQISMILHEIESLLYEYFSIKNKNCCVTIMHKDPKTQKWYYAYRTRKNWNLPKPQTIIDNKSSTAAMCFSLGEPVFHPCKQSASKSNKYYLDEKDKREGKGSVFCYPVLTTNGDYSDIFLISIATYGKWLCDPVDTEKSDAISEFLSDICSRLDLELTLSSIKDWQFKYHSKGSRESHE